MHLQSRRYGTDFNLAPRACSDLLILGSGLAASLFPIHGRRRGSRRRRRRRDRKGEPHVEAVRPVTGVEFAVAFQIQASLHVADRKKVSDLRTDADDARFEGTNPVARTTVTRNLVVEVADQSYE